VASRAQIIRLAQRIDALGTRFAPPSQPPAEHWFVEGDSDADPARAIASEAEESGCSHK
jgi:hypothetical protein